jgi:sortase A
VDALVRFLRARRWARVALSGLSAVLLVTAVGLLGYPLYTNVRQHRIQQHLSHQLASPQFQQTYRVSPPKEGEALTRIKIPRINVDVVVVEGTSASALRAGAGHYPGTPLPCEDGNVAIAGHRTTYGKPFANVDQLHTGDLIELQTPIGSCTYSVSQAPFVVLADGKLANGKSVVDNAPGDHLLTLTSCHPKGSASHRIIIRATLVKGLNGGA